MWRCARGNRIVHDEVFFILVFVAALFLAVSLYFAVTQPYEPSAVFAFGVFLVISAGVRRRVEIDRDAGRVRVRWVLAVTPRLPALTLRSLADLPLSSILEVVVGLPVPRTRHSNDHPVKLHYCESEHRSSRDVDDIRVALCTNRPDAFEIADRLAHDLGVPARDVESDIAPAIVPGP
jgi:hypothetical protein